MLQESNERFQYISYLKYKYKDFTPHLEATFHLNLWHYHQVILQHKRTGCQHLSLSLLPMFSFFKQTTCSILIIPIYTNAL